MSHGKDKFGGRGGVCVPVHQVVSAACCSNQNAWIALATLKNRLCRVFDVTTGLRWGRQGVRGPLGSLRHP